MVPTQIDVAPLSKWDIISDIIGWSYFFVWSISFYPQVYLNWRRKSVRGLSIDFLFYNVLGFFCYSIYNLAFYCNQEIRDQYQQRHPNSEHNLVRMNDVVFSVHGFLISLFILLQTCVYKKHESQHISSFAAAFVWLAVMGSVLVISTIHYGGAIWLDFMYYLSSVKLIVSFIKYLPQVWLNYKRQSTQGWSIGFIFWDLSGGLLSILQLLLDAYIDGDWSGIEGDNVKLGLGVIVVVYDAIFLIQHYILYPHNHTVRNITEERRRLISEGRVPIDIDEEEVVSEQEDSLSEVSSILSRKPRNANQHYGSTSHGIPV
ncbi:PQ loop repeat-domain-containing protein [Mucor lusitanicus]|uniref:Cystinosin n=2 Tax=Mucor circinelloides f. lusitanicus TaxID=29924 RepID=A0A168JAI0_MUCCL|nr:PQ loop repeat-domain-containing protein [Mucor lusitanicus]OAD00955.1 hypothetical protein MUCCIDRAFT_112376 [Mucor lusitanicus CBS 277.49]